MFGLTLPGVVTGFLKGISSTTWMVLGLLVAVWYYGNHMKSVGSAETKAKYEAAAAKLEAEQLEASNKIQQAADQRALEAQKVIEQLRQEIDNVKKLAAQEAGAKNVCISDAAASRLRAIGASKRTGVRPSTSRSTPGAP